MAYEKIDHVAFVDSDGNYSGGVELYYLIHWPLPPSSGKSLIH